MIKAIETTYRGYRFRSRLEARWAVFFDAMGLVWEYEPEGFELPGGVKYLPDFRVMTPQGRAIWYEVKPRGVITDEKVAAFNTSRFETDEPLVDPCYLLSGDPVQVLFEFSKALPNGHVKTFHVCPRCGLINDPDYGINEYHHSFVLFGCGPCDMETASGGGNPPELGLYGAVFVTPYKGSIEVSTTSYSAHRRRVRSAAEKARSARFEHGERERMAAV